MEKQFKTEYQIERENRDLEIYRAYNQMVAVPGRSKVEVAKFLARKYHIATVSTIYSIRKRVERLLKGGEL